MVAFRFFSYMPERVRVDGHYVDDSLTGIFSSNTKTTFLIITSLAVVVTILRKDGCDVRAMHDLHRSLASRFIHPKVVFPNLAHEP